MAYKMAIVVRTDLGMGKGKIAAQVAHAAVSLTLWNFREQIADPEENDRVERWFEDEPPQTKLVLKVSTEEDLLELAKKCKANHVPSVIICDAGKTQVEHGTRTVLGIGPGPEEEIDSIVGDLKLL